MGYVSELMSKMSDVQWVRQRATVGMNRKHIDEQMYRWVGHGGVMRHECVGSIRVVSGLANAQ